LSSALNRKSCGARGPSAGAAHTPACSRTLKSDGTGGNPEMLVRGVFVSVPSPA